ncbi:hypothetical protein B566_EDAN017037 [Ephemera danica]|nr:hypothetical protein B566_EDAN017037 [Ephemera danica]
MAELEKESENYKNEPPDSITGRKLLAQMQQTLILAQEVGDEKLQAVQTLQDLIENQSRLLETDQRNLDFGKDQENTEPNSKEITSSIHIQSHQTSYTVVSSNSAAGNSSFVSVSSITSANDQRHSKRVRRSRVEVVEEAFVGALAVQASTAVERVVETRGGNNLSEQLNKSVTSTVSGSITPINTPTSSSNQRKTTKKKKRKSKQDKEQRQQQQRRQQQDDSPQEMPIDPDEPTYCLCDQISYGEMILCDNDLCPIEWFHFSCVSLASKPKGKWFCPRCRGDRPNVMKPKAQFLKELERYNKEKEEKA